MRRITKWAIAAAAAVMLVAGAGSASAGTVPESKDTIKIALNEWTGQLVSAYLLGGILQRMG